MKSSDGKFEVSSARDLRAKYGLVAGRRPVLKLNWDKIPKELWPLIPYAEVWGISDDLIREDLVDKSPPQAVEELRKLLAKYSKELDDWLAGPEAAAESFSIEYVSFSSMRMAVDYHC